MRPQLIQRWIKSRSIKSVHAATGATITLAAACIALAPQAIACMFSPAPDKSAEIKLSLAPGVEAAVQISLFERKDDENPSLPPDCYASAYMPLSAFPSTSNRYGTNDIAAAIREQVDTWDLSKCNVTLYYENDTGVDLAEHELCVQGAFAFEKGSFWSSESEAYCWEPLESERIQSLITEAQAEAEAEEIEAQTEADLQIDDTAEAPD